MTRKVLLILLALVLALSVGLVACGGAGEEEEEEEEEEGTTPPVDSDEATEIVIEQVVQPFWEQADQTRGLRANQHTELLPEDTTVQPAFSTLDGGLPQITCESDCWLFMIDEAPGAHFGHGVQIVLVDAWTGEVDITETEWWPVVNGVPLFDTIEKRLDPETIVFYEHPLFDVEPVGEVELPPWDWSWLGCEAWAVIVCGYDDLPDTFDEDTNGIYDVLTNLGVPDDHIFYVSPHTTHTGVDRATSKANVQWAISQVASQADATDKVLFLYSSHGNIDYLTCTGVDSISAANLDNWLDGITCQHMIIIIEACHSGSFIGKYANGTYNSAENDLTGDGETNRAIFTSASTDTSSYPDVDGTDDPNSSSDVGSETIWGYVEAFSTPSADTNGDGRISFGEAFQYAWDNDVTRIRGTNVPQEEHNGLNIAEVYNYCPPAETVDIVDVGAPAINCIFDDDCTITVQDTTDDFVLTGMSGNAFLQSRTFPPGQPGTAGAGLYAYLYRIDCREMVGLTHISGVIKLTIDFGPVTKLDYDGDGNTDDVWVVTSGGLGNIAPSTAEMKGNQIIFEFSPGVAAGSSPGNGDSSYFFGLASAFPPHPVQCEIEDNLGYTYTLDARAPNFAP